jgi:hypothetical protein
MVDVDLRSPEAQASLDQAARLPDPVARPTGFGDAFAAKHDFIQQSLDAYYDRYGEWRRNSLGFPEI